MDIVKKLKDRTLSEEFYSRSPNSQQLIKSMASSTPTSKYRKEYTNLDKYNDPDTTVEEKQFMEKYGLVKLNNCITAKKQ
jgi:hypothetical protein